MTDDPRSPFFREATTTAVAMCAAASRGDWDGWARLLVVVPPPALISALSVVGQRLAERLAACLARPVEDLYRDVLLGLAQPELEGTR